MESRIIIKSKVNITPEAEIEESLAELDGSWRVTSATTTSTVYFGARDDDPRQIQLHHTVFCTTVVLEKP